MTSKSSVTRKIALIAFWGLFFLASSLLLPISSFAQSPVNVTATVLDSNSIPYANATVSILLIPSGGNPSVGGAAISGTNNGSLDANGKMNVSLYKNSDISPGGSQWQFTICETPGIAPPLGTGGQCFTSTQTISGAASLSTQFSAASKPLSTIALSGGGGGGLTFVASLPATCTPGVTQPVTLSVPPYGLYFCSATNTWTGNNGGLNALPTGTDSGVVNAYVVNPTPAVTLTQGQAFTFTTTNPNTGASTMNASGLGVKNIILTGGGVLASGNLLSGTAYQLEYDGTSWELIGSVLTAGAPAITGSSFALPAGAVGSQAIGGSLTLFTPPLTNVALFRSMFNLVCVGTGSGCNGGTPSTMYLGFDGDNVGIVGGKNLAQIAFTGPAYEAFTRWSFIENILLGSNDITIDPSVTKTSGDAICIANASAGACTNPLLEVASVTGAIKQCATFPIVNVTPVTTSGGAVTTDQNMMTATIPANCLNVVNRTLQLTIPIIYSTPAASTSAMTVKVKICSTSTACANNVLTAIAITSAALGTLQTTNNAINLDITLSVQTASTTLAIEGHGCMSIDLNASISGADTTFCDTNTTTQTGTPSAIDSTAQNFLVITGAFSGASASNLMTERQLVVGLLN